MERRITVKDVALRAGVKHGSVSVVLNGAKSNTHVSEAARARILSAASELGYRRNAGMAAARTGRFGCAALLLGTHGERSSLPEGLLRGIHDGLAALDMHLMITYLPDEKLTDDGVVPKILREWMVDGLLIDYTHDIPPRMLDLIREHALPAVWINADQPADCVRPDDQSAAKEATGHLIRLGHTAIAYADFALVSRSHYSVGARRAGYEAAMRAAGLEPHFLADGARLDSLLGRPSRPTALLCYGGEAEAVWTAAARLGLSVPEDVSLIAFASQARTLGGKTLTTWTVPERQVGLAAVEMLRRKIAAPREAFPSETTRFESEMGATAAQRNSEEGNASR